MSIGLSRRGAIGLCLGFCFSLACGGAPPGESTTPGASRPPNAEAPQSTPSRSPDENERRAIVELAHAAEQIRGLQFASPVPVLVQNRDAITQYVESQIEEDAITRGRTLYVALGLLPPDLDVRAQLLGLLGEQILGYYDAERKHLVVRDDVMHAMGTHVGDSLRLEEARLVLVHELVHALQDQHLKLSANIDKERTSDAENAFRSLIEGDASLAMIGYMFEQSGVPLRQLTSDPSRIRGIENSETRDAVGAGGEQLAGAPAILRVPLLSAYRDGLTFCAFAHSRGGWTAVDLAHDNPPGSTEHILHPEIWTSGQQADVVEIGDLPALTAAGFAPVETTTLGELETGVYFGLGQTQAEAERSAAGWGGDQVRVYQGSGAQTPVVWFTTWDDRREAAEAEAAAQLASRQGPASERSQGRVQRVGRAVLILRHVPEPLHASIVAAFTSWSRRLPSAPPVARAGQ